MRFRWTWLVAMLAVAALAGQPDAEPHAVLVTIDGLRGDYLSDADGYGLALPTLRAMMRAGALSGNTRSVFPTLTGPAHTALVTGARAGRHGILGNNRFDPTVWRWEENNYDRQPSYRDHAQVLAETLWTAADRAGLSTAAIGWPQTLGGPITYRLDILVAPTHAESHARIAQSASSGPWLSEIEERLGPLGALDLRMADQLKARVGAEILERYRPAFMAVHFSLTDAVQHAEGPGTPEALRALEETDGNLAVLVDGVARAGLEERTLVVVTGDHGFLPLHTELAVNLPLVEAGLITRRDDGTIEWRAIVVPNRGLGAVYVRDGDTAAASAARVALEHQAVASPGRFRLLERAELDAEGADPEAVFGVEPLPGYVVDGRLRPPFEAPHRRAAGHGYRPGTAGMETGLVVTGPRVRPGVTLPVSYTIDVAPTIARWIGVKLGDAEGHAMDGIFEEDDDR